METRVRYQVKVSVVPDPIWEHIITELAKLHCHEMTHSMLCSDQNALHPIGRYLGAEDCWCNKTKAP